MQSTFRPEDGHHKRRNGEFSSKRAILLRKAVLFSFVLSSIFSAQSFGEERVYGISSYGPVSVNGYGVGRGKDPSYEYIEDLLYNNNSSNNQKNSSSVNNTNAGTNAGPNGSGKTAAPFRNLAQLSRNGATKTLSTEIDAKYAVVFDLDNGSILGEKNAGETMTPASMTKVMTLLLCVENLSDPEKKLTITEDIVNYIQQRGASNCGFVVGEEVPVKDLLYGVILPSGADAVLALT